MFFPRSKHRVLATRPASMRYCERSRMPCSKQMLGADACKASRGTSMALGVNRKKA
jgi:hypothetical protein